MRDEYRWSPWRWCAEFALAALLIFALPLAAMVVLS